MKEDRFKLLYLDVGLLQTATRTDAAHFFEQEILQINAGMITALLSGQDSFYPILPDLFIRGAR